MSSSVCQGLQSCLEPRLVEPFVVIHKLAPPKSSFSQSFPWLQSPFMPLQQEKQENSHNPEKNNNGYGETDPKINNNGELGGWSFLQSLPKTTQNFIEESETEKAYVHPLFKRSASTLSTKSLEMCTESLGSETGSDISESIDELSSLSLENQKFRPIQRSKSREWLKKPSRPGSFPPPLSSISGSDNVQVRPHREAGRLVLKAVTVSSCNTLFLAERVDGRLRLCLVNDYSVNCDSEMAKDEEDVEEDENIDEDEEESDDDDEVENEEDDAEYWDEDMEGNSGKVGCEIGIGELPRPTRCKESGSKNKGMPNWGVVCVAIS